MNGIPSSCPFLSSVARISSLLRISTHSPTLRLRLLFILNALVLICVELTLEGVASVLAPAPP
jgi:hypothetical protein